METTNSGNLPNMLSNYSSSSLKDRNSAYPTNTSDYSLPQETSSEDSEDEVTHTQFFGENIRRVIKGLFSKNG